MRSLRVGLMAVASVLSVSMLQAQTVDELVNKHIAAMGGKEKLSSIKSLYTEYDMEIMGNSAGGSTYILNGKGYRNEVDFNGSKIVQVITDKGGWGINPMMGQSSPTVMPADQVKMAQGQLDVGGPLFNYAAKGYAVELAGTEELSGVKAYKLKMKSKDGMEGTIWLDPTTYYILKSTNKAKLEGQEIETSVSFSNYKKTDYGFVAPGNTEITLPQGLTLNITSKKVEVNKDIDPKMFEMPK
jgi:outer membrane lipoprotein-sorting protein